MWHIVLKHLKIPQFQGLFDIGALAFLFLSERPLWPWLSQAPFAILFWFLSGPPWVGLNWLLPTWADIKSWHWDLISGGTRWSGTLCTEIGWVFNSVQKTFLSFIIDCFFVPSLSTLLELWELHLSWNLRLKDAGYMPLWPEWSCPPCSCILHLLGCSWRLIPPKFL